VGVFTVSGDCSGSCCCGGVGLGVLLARGRQPLFFEVRASLLSLGGSGSYVILRVFHVRMGNLVSFCFEGEGAYP
jgi:hypothetical protein